MFLIPGALVSAATFPGVVVHELAHQLFCRRYGIPVYEVRYFRFGNPAGYVLHGKPARWNQQVMIGLGPFFINSILGAVIAFPSSIRVFELDGHPTLIDGLLVWLGVSIAMHAIPSTGDAKSMWRAVAGRRAPLGAKLLVAPVVGVTFLLAIGSFFWVDLAYGIVVSLILPKLLLTALA